MSKIVLTEDAAPTNPIAGKMIFYATADHFLEFMDSTGAITRFTTQAYVDTYLGDIQSALNTINGT